MRTVDVRHACSGVFSDKIEHTWNIFFTIDFITETQ